MNDFNDFLTFRKMITPTIIQIIFWIGIVLCVVGGIVYIVLGAVRDTASGVLYGLVTLIIGPLVVRIYCELLILMFRMNDSLTEINNKIGHSDSEE